MKTLILSCLFPGTGEAFGGPARLHRPPEHSGKQVLLHDAGQQRGREAMKKKHALKQQQEKEGETRRDKEKEGEKIKISVIIHSVLFTILF